MKDNGIDVSKGIELNSGLGFDVVSRNTYQRVHDDKGWLRILGDMLEEV